MSNNWLSLLVSGLLATIGPVMGCQGQNLLVNRIYKNCLCCFSFVLMLFCSLSFAGSPRVSRAFVLPSSTNFWAVLQADLDVGGAENNRAVKKQLRAWLANPQSLQRVINNAVPYLYYVTHEVRARHMPAMIALLPFVESDYNPGVYSARGAGGLWQMMPATAGSYHLDISWWYDSRRNIRKSTTAALNYLLSLHTQFNNWDLALAAYDAGIGAVTHAMIKNKRAGRSMDFWSLPLSKETKGYVPKLLAIALIIKHPARYHVQLPYIPNKPYFVPIVLNAQMDLGQLSSFTGVSAALLKRLNPDMRRFATSPDGEHALLIPADALERLHDALVNHLGQAHVSWQYHEVRAHETLYSIARNYHTSPLLLHTVNALTADHLQIGQGILVPVHMNAKYHLPNVKDQFTPPRMHPALIPKPFPQVQMLPSRQPASYSDDNTPMRSHRSSFKDLVNEVYQ